MASQRQLASWQTMRHAELSPGRFNHHSRHFAVRVSLWDQAGKLAPWYTGCSYFKKTEY
ncbi:predicted protein [Histoplasma mississippiense (nom. inval.)]|uniref:predicted protein n=1 Tax=Ajellomyces capsulatus (strain NAm1 / WU24) TaxID=2059318 RepID=UPI000157CF87|nr:predicted protein [Histoplasma mississippiense (nom. inval.)]EDN11189.1 predicted protein [Histoplasma mississippiense (nom. inval.)]